MYFYSQANKFFYKIIALAAVILIGIGFIIWRLTPFFLAASRSLTNQLSAVCGCANHWHFANHPFIFSALISGGILLAGCIGYAVLKTIRLIWRTDSFIKQTLKSKNKNLTTKLIKAARQTGLIGKIMEIEKEEPTIFCFGFWRPKICLSKSLVKHLNPAELRAVLLHEKQHLLSGEPRKAMLIKILTNLLFFLPGWRALTIKYLTYSELSADERATANFKNKMPLARALCKIIKWKESWVMKKQLALSFFDEVTEERVNKLADDNYQPRIKIFTSLSILKLSFLAIGLALFLISPRLTSAKQEMLSCVEMPAAKTTDAQCHWPAPAADTKECSVINQYASTHSSCNKQ
ncbi:MAG: M56 family metallopeptidase [Patescibacteria group bacterium]